MSEEFKAKLQSLHFSVRPPTHKRIVEGDQREGSVVTESAERQDVQVFVPPVAVQMDMQMVGEVREKAADDKADQARHTKGLDVG